MNEGFAKEHLTNDVDEDMDLDYLFKWVALKKNLTGVDKISQFTSKVGVEWIVPPMKGKEDALLKAETKLKTEKTQQPKKSKKQQILEKISNFGYKIPKFQISGRTGWEGNLGLKTAKIMKDHWKGKRTQG